jgi:hypothetical protein
VIRHPTIKAIIDQSIGRDYSSSEDLVQMSTQLVGEGVRVECSGEIEEVEFAKEVVDVVIKVSTYHNRSIRILPQDVFDDVCHPHRFPSGIVVPLVRGRNSTLAPHSHHSALSPNRGK